MPDHKKTEEIYLAAGYKLPLSPDAKERHPPGTQIYSKPPKQQDEEQWFAKVTNPNTGRFYQVSDLPAENRHTNKVYPIKHVIQMARVQTADEKEYLQSFQEWIAIDKLGNEINMTFTAPETWDRPTFERAYRSKDPRNPDGPKEIQVVGTQSITREYTLPFTTKNADNLYAMRRTKTPGSVSLSIRRVGLDGVAPIDHVYEVKNYDDFISKGFNELWDYLSTPKYRLDRSYNDNLESSHIK
jgi:hypothetical protein